MVYLSAAPALSITGHFADRLSLAALIVDQSRFHTGLTILLRSGEEAAEPSASKLAQSDNTLQVVSPRSHRHERSYGHRSLAQ
jgi:hypothetical protein